LINYLHLVCKRALEAQSIRVSQSFCRTPSPLSNRTHATFCLASGPLQRTSFRVMSHLFM